MSKIIRQRTTEAAGEMLGNNLSDIGESTGEAGGVSVDKVTMIDEKQDVIQEAIAQLIGPTEMSPEVMFHLEDIEKELAGVRKEVD